jgi:hypothetical protein
MIYMKIGHFMLNYQMIGNLNVNSFLKFLILYVLFPLKNQFFTFFSSRDIYSSIISLLFLHVIHTSRTFVILFFYYCIFYFLSPINSLLFFHVIHTSRKFIPEIPYIVCSISSQESILYFFFFT